jgi:hypothetical protein
MSMMLKTFDREDQKRCVKRPLWGLKYPMARSLYAKFRVFFHEENDALGTSVGRELLNKSPEEHRSRFECSVVMPFLFGGPGFMVMNRLGTLCAVPDGNPRDHLEACASATFFYGRCLPLLISV